ncbi:MAG TPA: DUF6691 family protein [Gemmatimonadaceae bacterium]|nr:DUF6691 family protein [Gemmatimonadaceae bacterium]
MTAPTGTSAPRQAQAPPAMLASYLLLGAFFGVILTKSEVISWFRIQEMFRFQSLHMYLIIGSAIVTAALSLAVIRRLQVRALSGEPISVPPKTLGKGTRYWLGGSIFGLGWALTGACPGPLFALVGAGFPVIAVAILSAVAGTWTYGRFRPRLPH